MIDWNIQLSGNEISEQVIHDFYNPWMLRTLDDNEEYYHYYFFDNLDDFLVKLFEIKQKYRKNT